MKVWLRCRISKGMFSDEVTATVAFGGRSFAVFVPRNEVREDDGLVKVRSFERSGKTFAVFPDESQTAVPVEPGDLQPA